MDSDTGVILRRERLTRTAAQMMLMRTAHTCTLRNRPTSITMLLLLMMMTVVT